MDAAEDIVRIPMRSAPHEPVIQAQLDGQLAQLELAIVKAVRPNWYVIFSGIAILIGVLGFMYHLAITPLQDSLHDTRTQLMAVQQTLVQLQTQAAQTNDAVNQLGHRLDKVP